MKLVNGAVIRETEWPGCIGDSMRETANLQAMLKRLRIIDVKGEYDDLSKKIYLPQFRTFKGYLRHPDAPPKGLVLAPAGYINAGAHVEVKTDWQESDTSGDQYILWYREITKQSNGEDLQKEMRSRIYRNFMRYGNNNLIHPGFFAEITDWNWLRWQSLDAQANLFELEYRYNDEGKSLEKTADSSADYWIWSAIACDQEKWLRERVPARVLKEKFAAYLKDEPNHQWYLDIACRFADLYF